MSALEHWWRGGGGDDRGGDSGVATSRSRFQRWPPASHAGGAVPAVGWCTGQVPARGPTHRMATSSSEEAKPIWVLLPLSPVLWLRWMCPWRAGSSAHSTLGEHLCSPSPAPPCPLRLLCLADGWGCGEKAAMGKSDPPGLSLSSAWD